MTTFVARPESLELLDEDGAVVYSLEYAGSVTDAVAILTEVFGEAATQVPYRGTNHTPPGIDHTWGSLIIDERRYQDWSAPESERTVARPSFAAYFSGPDAFGFSLRSEQGTQAGDSWERASDAPGFDAEMWTCFGTPIETAEVVLPSGDARTATVVVTRDEATGTVSLIGAPEMKADGCA